MNKKEFLLGASSETAVSVAIVGLTNLCLSGLPIDSNYISPDNISFGNS